MIPCFLSASFEKIKIPDIKKMFPIYFSEYHYRVQTYVLFKTRAG